jgi:hypothetical protein
MRNKPAQKKARRLGFAVVAIGAVALLAATPALASPSASGGGSGQAGYNAIPAKVTGNVPSVGFEATQTAEFGDEVALGGGGKSLRSMSVVLSSWGCESGTWQAGCETTPGTTFDVPITFTVYADDGGSPGAVLASKVENVTVAYRPTASDRCTNGKWYNSKDRTCYSGVPQTVTVSFDGTVTLSEHVFWSVSYNTTHAGRAPVGESASCYGETGGCGYDSLNVGAWSAPNAPFSGTDLDTDLAFVNGSMDSGWTGLRPLGALVTK